MSNVPPPMKILVVGVGVIGTVYGAQLAADGHEVAVLDHGRRTAGIATHVLRARDISSGEEIAQAARVVRSPGQSEYDLVLVAVRREQLRAALTSLGTLSGHPTILLFGNNPGGRGAEDQPIAGKLLLGFPGIGGTFVDDVAQYVLIKQQPTTLQRADNDQLDEFALALEARRFVVRRVRDMGGWLAYHAVFVSCVAAALYRCDTNAETLGRNPDVLRLMCRAITDGFAILRRQGVAGLPTNLAVLHTPLLAPVAIRYWGRTMRSGVGEVCFAAHARHARNEMRVLGDDVLAMTGSRADPNLRTLLSGS